MLQVIGDRLKILREERAVSQDQMAKDLGLSRLSVGNYERGVRTPEAETIIKMAEYFNTSTDYLLGVSLERYKKSCALPETWQEMLITAVTNRLAVFFSAYNQKMKPIEDENIFKAFYIAILGNSARTINSCVNLINNLSEIKNVDIDEFENIVDAFTVNCIGINIKTQSTGRVFSTNDVINWLRAWIDIQRPEYVSYREHLAESATVLLADCPEDILS